MIDRARTHGTRLLVPLFDAWCDSLCLHGRRERAHTGLLLGRRCASTLRDPRTPSCATCGRPLADAAPDRRCGECRAQPRALDRLFVRYVFAPPCSAVIHALKFRGLTFLAPRLADACCDQFRPELLAVDLVVPVPLHPWRRLGRGHNPSAGLAYRVAQRLSRPAAGVLVRRGWRSPQSALKRQQRLGNLRHAFRPRRRAISRLSVAGHVLLVDDVVTTGTTLEAAAGVLKAMGATRVSALVVARTEAPAERGLDRHQPAGGSEP